MAGRRAPAEKAAAPKRVGVWLISGQPLRGSAARPAPATVDEAAPAESPHDRLVRVIAEKNEKTGAAERWRSDGQA